MDARGRTHALSRSRQATLALTLLFVLTAVSVSTGLVAHTAWTHDLGNGLFAILLAVLSSKAALSWMLWSSQRSAISRQQNPEDRKPADATTR